MRPIRGETFTTNFTLSANLLAVTFIFSSDFAGVINNVAYNGANDDAISIDLPGGEPMGAFVGTISAGSVRVVFA